MLRLWKFAEHHKGSQISYAAKFVLDRFPHRCLEGILRDSSGCDSEIVFFFCYRYFEPTDHATTLFASERGPRTWG